MGDLKTIFEVYAALDTGEGGAEHLHTMNMNEFKLILSHCELLDEDFDETVVNTIFENIQQEEDDEELEEDEDEDADDYEYDQHDVVVDDADDVILINSDRDDEAAEDPSKQRFGYQPTGMQEFRRPSKQGLEGVGDASELAFSEFVDGLVAIVMYKDPNPFVPFSDRVGNFLKDLFFKGLHKHWTSVDDVDRGFQIRTKLLPRLKAMVEPPPPPPPEPKKEVEAKGAKETKSESKVSAEPTSPKKMTIRADNKRDPLNLMTKEG